MSEPYIARMHQFEFSKSHLRDFFAGLAMQALIEVDGLRDPMAGYVNAKDTNAKDTLAARAYRCADTMLAEREKRKDEK